MEKQPDYFAIAGPNGAGKSTSGNLFVPAGLEIFNGDIEFANLQIKYPLIDPERLQGALASILENAKFDALEKRKDFAFETNYSTDMATEMTMLFKNAGYQTTLIYFGLNSLMESAARVEQRINDGGHDVSNKVLKYNLEEGVKRINHDLHLFDTIVFADTQKQQLRIIAAINNKQGLQYTIKEELKWYTENFKSKVKRQELKQVQKIRDVLPRLGKRFRM